MRHETFIRAADFRPSTYDPEALTIEAVAFTSAPVARRDDRGSYVEVLDVAAVDRAALVGLPVFSDHYESVSTAAGRVVEAWRDGDAWAVRIRLSAASDTADLRTKIAEGTVRGVSIGGSVTRWVDSRDAAGRRVRTAAEWRPTEISFVGRPADPNATVRSASMPTTEQNAAPEGNPTPDLGALQAQIAELRAEIARAASPAAEPQRPVIRASVGASNEDPAVVTRRMAEALAADAAGVPPTDEGANQYRGMGLHGLVRMVTADVPGARYMGTAALVETAIARQHSTSDLPAILQGVGQRIVGHNFETAASPLVAALAVSRTVADFREQSEVNLGSFPSLPELSENGEIKAVTIGEGSEKYRLSTFAARWDANFRMFANDDLGLLARVPAELGRAARRTLDERVIAVLTTASGAGPTMGDGYALFSSQHGNVAASGAAIGETTLQAAITAVRGQTTLGGQIAGIAPKYLIVSPANEWAARKALAAIAPAETAKVNTVAGALELIVEPRLTGTRWYVAADRSQAPVLATIGLAGHAGPQVQRDEAFNTLAISFRVVMHAGAAAIDHRGMYANAGA